MLCAEREDDGGGPVVSKLQVLARVGDGRIEPQRDVVARSSVRTTLLNSQTREPGGGVQRRADLTDTTTLTVSKLAVDDDWSEPEAVSPVARADLLIEREARAGFLAEEVGATEISFGASSTV